MTILLNLVLFLLQSTVLIFLGLGIARAFGAGRAVLRQIVYRCTFLAVLACPLISLCLPKYDTASFAVPLPERVVVTETKPGEEPEVLSPQPFTQSEAAPLVSRESVTETPSEEFSQPEMFMPMPLVQESMRNASEEPAVLMAETPESTVSEAFSFQYLLVAMFVIWGIGAAFFVSKIVLSWRRSVELMRHAVGVERGLQDRLETLSHRLRIRTRVRMMQNPFLAGPCLLGIQKPVLLLPDTIPESDRELDAILVHELAHLLRHDIAWLLLGRLACALLFFQPLLLLLKRQMRQTAEEICDDEVLRFGVDSRLYAEQLLEVAAKYVPGEMLPECVLPMASRKSRLRSRVERILDSSRIVSVVVSRKIVTLTILLAILFTLVTGSFSLEVAENRPEEAVTENTVETTEETVTEITVEGETDGFEFTRSILNRERKPIPGAKVVVRLLKEDEMRGRHSAKNVVTEYRLITDAEGQYRFRLTKEQLADRELTIHIAAAHPDYISCGFINGNLWQNEKLARIPGTEMFTLVLEPSVKVSGTVATPEGKPAASVLVYSSSVNEHIAQTATRTDAQGKFTIGTLPGKDRLLWVLPNEYAALSLKLDEDDAELGTLQLQKGVTFQGRAVDPEGKPVPGVWLSLLPKDTLGVRWHGHDAACRSAITDKNGEFRFRPVMPGEYVIETGILMEYDDQPMTLARESAYVDLADPEFWSGEVSESTPPPANNDTVPFAQQLITITEEPVQEFVYRGKGTVAWNVELTGETVRNQPSLTAFFSGQLDGLHWSTRKTIEKDDAKPFRVELPEGLKNAHVTLYNSGDGCYFPMKFRFSKDEPWRNNWYASLGDVVEKDLHFSLELQPYQAGVVRSACVKPDGKPLAQNLMTLRYKNVDFEDPKTVTINGDTVYTGIERHPLGVEWDLLEGESVMWRYYPVLADEEFTLIATGFDDTGRYEPEEPQTLTLKSGETREVIVTVKKRVTNQPPVVKTLALKIVTPEEKPLANAEVEVRMSPAPKEWTTKAEQFVRTTRYGTVLKTDENGVVPIRLPEEDLSFLNCFIRVGGYSPFVASWGAQSFQVKSQSVLSCFCFSTLAVETWLIRFVGLRGPGGAFLPGGRFVYLPYGTNIAKLRKHNANSRGESS